MVKTVNNWAK